MGVTRKFFSLCTFGLIDWRSDRERTARSARLTKRATKKGNRLLAQQNALLAQQARQVPVQPPPMVPVTAGWYPDIQDPRLQRWWDGRQWTPTTRPASP